MAQSIVNTTAASMAANLSVSAASPAIVGDHNGSGNGSVDSGGGDPEAYLYDLGARIFIIVDVLLVALGCIGNFITLLVSLRKSLRSSPVSIFIAALAVSDIIVLLLDFLNNWLDLQLSVYLMGFIPFCLFHRWFFNVAYTNSAWLVSAVAIERFIVVWFPLSAKRWCTVKRTLITIIVMPIILCVLYAYNFATWHVAESGKCDVLPYHAPFMNEVSPWLTAVLYSYIPLTVVIFASTGILVRLVSAKQKRAAMTSDSTADRYNRKITTTVLAICAAFACLTIPLTVWYIWVFATRQFIQQSARIVFIEIMILIFGLTNHAINFPLYVLTSERFRQELAALFGCTKGSTKARMGRNGGASAEVGKTQGDKSFSTGKTSVGGSEQSINTVSSAP